MSKTEKEYEDEQEKLILIHALRMGQRDWFGICNTSCGDKVCNAGCLGQKAELFRPQIIQAVKLWRDKNWDRYSCFSIYADKKVKRTCSKQNTCRFNDPICDVVGCMNIPAYNYRALIALALKECEIEEKK